MGRNASWKISFIPYYMTAPARWAAPSPLEAIGVLKGAGYDGVEWMLGHHFDGPREMKRLVSRTEASGLAVSDIMCWQDLVSGSVAARRASTQLLQEMVEAAAEASVPIMNIFTGPMTWLRSASRLGVDIKEGEAWSAVVVDSLTPIVEAAERHRVTVTIEPVFGMLVHDYYTLRELLGRFDSKFLAVNLDPSHLALYGNDPVWVVSRLRERIRHVHVKDVFGRPGALGETFSFPFLGEGVIPWSGFFRALRDVGYDGFLSLEFENDSYLRTVCGGDWSVAAALLMERVKKFIPSSSSTRGSGATM